MIYGLSWITGFGHSWGDSPIIFTCDCVTHENYCRCPGDKTTTRWYWHNYKPLTWCPKTKTPPGDSAITTNPPPDAPKRKTPPRNGLTTNPLRDAPRTKAPTDDSGIKRKPPCIGGMELVSLSCNRVFISAESVGRGWCKIAIATKWYQFHTTDKCGFLFMPWITDQYTFVQYKKLVNK